MKINDLGFDNLNSCCKPMERPSKELVRQLDILAVERRPEACLGCRRSCRRWKAYQLALKIIKERAKKHRYLDPMPDSRTNEVKNRTKKYKGFSQ